MSTDRPAGLTGFVLEDRDGTPLLTLTIPGIALRVLTVAPVALTLGALHLVAPDTPWWPSLLILLMAVVAAELPDSAVGMVTLGTLVLWWLVAAGEPAIWWALLVSACGLVFHAALAHASAGPPGATPTLATVTALSGRCGVVLLVTAGIALVVDVAEEWGEPPAVTVAVTLALVGALPWWAARRSANRE